MLVGSWKESLLIPFCSGRLESLEREEEKESLDGIRMCDMIIKGENDRFRRQDRKLRIIRRQEPGRGH